MRTTSAARFAFYALALTVAASAATADSKTKSAKSSAKTAVAKTKSLAACTSFDQVDKDDDKVEFTVHNTCSVPIDCVITWRLVCAPDSKRRSVHAGSAKLSLSDLTSGATEADASTCKADSWTLDQVRWNCQPNKN